MDMDSGMATHDEAASTAELLSWGAKRIGRGVDRAEKWVQWDGRCMVALSGWVVAALLVISVFVLQGDGESLKLQKSLDDACIEQLPERVAGILRQGAPSALWGAHVVSPHLGELVSLQGNQSLVPASNNKLLTASAALLLLGRKFRYRTEAVTVGNVACITPAGDPTFGDVGMLSLARQLQEGADRNLSLAVAVPKVLRTGAPSTWEVGDLKFSYGALPGRSIVNKNTIQVRVAPGEFINSSAILSFRDEWDHLSVGELVNNVMTVDSGQCSRHGVYMDFRIDEESMKVALHASGCVGYLDTPYYIAIATRVPLRLFALRWASATFSVGLVPAGTNTFRLVESCTDLPGEVHAVGSWYSPASTTIINTTLLHSDNLYAESLLRALAPDGSVEAGIMAARRLFYVHEVSPFRGWAMADGSGLSRHNLVAPQTLTSLLSKMIDTDLPNLLPIAGRSGTLAKRMRNTVAEGRVRAKTGTMTGISALSGYADALDSRVGRVSFSLIANDANIGSSTLRDAQDEVMLALIQSRVC